MASNKTKGAIDILIQQCSANVNGTLLLKENLSDKLLSVTFSAQSKKVNQETDSSTAARVLIRKTQNSLGK